MSDQQIGLFALLFVAVITVIGIAYAAKGRRERERQAQLDGVKLNPIRPVQVELATSALPISIAEHSPLEFDGPPVSDEVRCLPSAPFPRTEHAPFALSGTSDCAEAIEAAKIGDLLRIEEDEDSPGGYLVYDMKWEQLGKISKRNKVAQLLDEGASVLQAQVNSVSYDGNGDAKMRIRVVTGGEGKGWELVKVIAESTFPVGLVGEHHYQDAVQRCRTGIRVQLLREPDNPYDAGAIVAVLADGATLGYIPRDSFVYRAVNDEGKGAVAIVRSKGIGERGFVQLVLDVTLDREGLKQRAFMGT